MYFIQDMVIKKWTICLVGRKVTTKVLADCRWLGLRIENVRLNQNKLKK